MLRLVRTCFEISALADVLVVTDYVFQKNLEELMSWQFLVGYPYPFLLYTYDSHGSGSPSYPDYIWDPKSVFYLHNINYVAHSILPSSSSYFTTPKKLFPLDPPNDFCYEISSYEIYMPLRDGFKLLRPSTWVKKLGLTTDRCWAAGRCI